MAAVLLVGKLAHTGIAFSRDDLYSRGSSVVDELVAKAGYTLDGLKTDQ
ncbi:MAG: hypothetical protein ACLU4N_21740 [Butyricimonas faecihominis]